MIIFTVIALLRLAEYLKRKSARIYRLLDGNYYFLTLMFLIFFGFSTIFNLVRDVDYFKNRYYKFYLPNEYKEAAAWLSTARPGVIFGQSFNSWLLPGLANLTIYMGHEHETIYAKDKGRKVEAFFADSLSDEEAAKFFKDNNLTYLFYADIERNYYPYSPVGKDYLEKVWQQGQIEIYQFK